MKSNLPSSQTGTFAFARNLIPEDHIFSGIISFHFTYLRIVALRVAGFKGLSIKNGKVLYYNDENRSNELSKQILALDPDESGLNILCTSKRAFYQTKNCVVKRDKSDWI